LKIGFVSLGCPKNLVDSEVMMGNSPPAGTNSPPNPEEADVIVVNTCSFIDPAKKESIDTILEMAEYKNRQGPRSSIVAGCLVERYRSDIRQHAPRSGCRPRHQRTRPHRRPLRRLSPEADPAEPYLYHDLTPRILATPATSPT
jgi:ribosomal protein S12 methylthiotransferase